MDAVVVEEPVKEKLERVLSGSFVKKGRAVVDGRAFSRSGVKLRIQGVTYGPFAPNTTGEPFPERTMAVQDFSAMKKLGINALRLYHVPPDWFLDLADEREMLLLVGVPWSQHVCFLDDPGTLNETRTRLRQAAERGRAHACVLGYVIANEISPQIIRWYGAPRVERFLRELLGIVKTNDPEALVTYASFPSTEYLDLSWFDFVTFNVYLHDLAAFRRYVNHLQILAGDKPLLLGELGMDTMRHGEEEQAVFLAGHLRETVLMGVAGSFVFSWTDEWHTGGCRIEDWAFGLTRADRTQKLSCKAVSDVFHQSPSSLRPFTSRVSVVVCSYNGGETLEQCLESLVALDYPDYEIILVDDGSTDNTKEIAARFPSVRTIHQENQGLSAARNTGLQTAGGSIIAYTDSDCFVDPDWLTHLVHQLESCDAVAVGGPNLTPDDGWIAACVAASPGQPTHVLESDLIAEHIPGCNMAYRREALEAINGFNPRYRKAGDDVDVCWRLQQEQEWITFAPGAFVWHHRRQNPRAYLKQQAGYGEAEGLLWFDHPDRFNARGESMWRGRMYGAAAEGLRLGQPVIYHGIWGTGLFQTLYQPAAAHWALLPATIEWHFVALGLAAVALAWPSIWALVGVMITFSLTVAGLRGFQAPLAPAYRSLKARLLISLLCYIQPLARSLRRYRARMGPDIGGWKVPRQTPCSKELPPGLRWLRGQTVDYWSEEWPLDRTKLLSGMTARFAAKKLHVRLDPGWDNWDMEVYCGTWTALRIYTTQEEHGQGRRLVRTRYRIRSSIFGRMIAALGLLTSVVAAGLHSAWTVGMALGIFLTAMILWWRGSSLASRVVEIVDIEARTLGLARVNTP